MEMLSRQSDAKSKVLEQGRLETNLGVTSVWMVFKATEPDEIT